MKRRGKPKERATGSLWAKGLVLQSRQQLVPALHPLGDENTFAICVHGLDIEGILILQKSAKP